MADVSVTADAFAAGLDEIFNEVRKTSGKALSRGVKKGASASAKAWRKGAPVRTGGYAKSIRYRVVPSDDKPSATVYSKKPGLPHLLEKGHATVGGGFVAPRVHIAPAAEEGFDAAMRAVEDEMGVGGL